MKQIEGRSLGFKTPSILLVACVLSGVSLFLPEVSLSRFYCIRLENTAMNTPTLQAANSQGIQILEPLPENRYLAWSTRDNLFKNKSIHLPRGSIEPVPDGAFSPFYPTPAAFLENKISGRYCLWILRNTNEPDIMNWLTRRNIEVIHKSQLILADHISYDIIGVQLADFPIAQLSVLSHLRCIYRESGSPEMEDELSVLEVLQGWEDSSPEFGLFETLRKFGTNGGRTRVSIIDSGCDTNSNQDCHPDLRGRIYRYITYTGSPGFDYVGHGTHLSGIIAGTGISRAEDTDGFNFGLGFSPVNPLTVSDALLASPFPPPEGYPGMIRDVALTGSHICNNSWNDGEGSGVGYHPNCAIWDAAVRNADPSLTYASAWPIACIFSIGNAGPASQTITSPKEAKNIITVGATGSLRSGSPESPLELSSRGPCIDGRNAPLLCAPGDVVYSCWPRDAYKTQTGTSVAAAHVTGGAVLLYEWWKDRIKENPSPALLKALLTLNASPLESPWPSPVTGWGRLDFQRKFPDYPTATICNQSILLTPEENTQWIVEVCPWQGEEPLDLVLAWTDMPAAPGANPALINDLNLKVISNGSIYWGNCFDGNVSYAGGNPDTLNNLERVRLINPGNSVTVIVEGADIRGDGVPGNGIPADQDFALAVNGGILSTDPPTIHVNETRVSGFHRIDILAAGISESAGTEFPVHVTSLGDPQGIVVNLPRWDVNNNGIFKGFFHTGHRSRKDEISVLPADILELHPVCCPANQSLYIPVDADPPSVREIAFADIRARSTTISIQTSDICDLMIFYREKGAHHWQTQPSNLQQQNHDVTLADLLPRTTYEMTIALLDLAGNPYSSSHDLPLIEWNTNQSQVRYAEYLNGEPSFESLDGLWQWGIPLGYGTPPDPTGGNTGNYVLGYNLEGNYENRLSPMHAVSPVLDCSDTGHYILSFHRWLGTESGIFDQATVSANTRDNQWDVVWYNPYFDVLDREWQYQTIDVTQQAEENEEFQFRFTQGQTDGGFSRCGWNIDDIILEHQPYSGPTPKPVVVSPEPELNLEINRREFFPGDYFYLKAIVTCQGASTEMSLAVSVTEWDSNSQAAYFFPSWTSSFDWIDIKHPSRGAYPVYIADFYLPETLEKPVKLKFNAYLFNKDTNYIYAISPGLPVVLRAR